MISETPVPCTQPPLSKGKAQADATCEVTGQTVPSKRTLVSHKESEISASGEITSHRLYVKSQSQLRQGQICGDVWDFVYTVVPH